jgi:hypothetical protein
MCDKRPALFVAGGAELNRPNIASFAAKAEAAGDFGDHIACFVYISKCPARWWWLAGQSRCGLTLQALRKRQKQQVRFFTHPS